MSLTVDHLMWVVADLDGGCREIETRFGTAPRPGGSHVGRGTCNALLSFSDGRYLEVLAPDRNQVLDGTQGEALAGLAEPRLQTFCCRGEPLDEIGERARALGLGVDGPVDYQRRRPDGVLLEWRLLFLREHDFGGLLPFFIDWGDAPHPADEMPAPIGLGEVVAVTPDPDTLSGLVTALGLPLRVHAGSASALQASLHRTDADQQITLT